MTFDSSKPLKMAGRYPAPQYWNDEIGDWEVVQGSGGSYRMSAPTKLAKEPFGASGNLTKEFASEMNGFVIRNDGNADLTFTIGGDTYTVKAGEVFEEEFAPFTTVTIASTVAYRAYGKVTVGGIVIAPQPTPDTTAPDNVTNLVTSSITQNNLTLTWTASASSDCVGYDVYRGSTLLGSVTGTNYNVTGLTASTQYTFTVKAKDAANNIASGASVTSTTAAQPADTTPPADVTGLASSNITETGVTLSWTAPEEAVSYDIFIGSTLLANVTATTYNVTGLTAATFYTLTVRAKDLAGNSSNGSSTTVTTSATPDTTAPNNVASVSTSDLSPTGVTLTWPASTSSDVSGYDIYNGSTLVTSVSGLTYSFTGLTASTSYTLWVKAKDAAGNVANGTSTVVNTPAVVDTTAPATVTGLSAGTASDTNVPLTWTLSASGDVTTQEVAYSTDGFVSDSHVFSASVNPSSNAITVTGLMASTAYTFRVVAIDAAGNRSVAATTTKTTAAPTAIPVSGVTLNKSTVSIFSGNMSQLTATVAPADATIKTVSWSSSNTAVATVNNSGLVDVIAAGTATITVTTTDGAKTASCVFTVTQADSFDYNNLVADSTKDTPVSFDQVVQGYSDFVHPSVLYFEDGWNGYKYWMGINPYPGTNGTWEDPFIFHSNDGEAWTTPTGLTPPIYVKGTGINNNSDAHIIMDYDGVTMHYLNRAVRTSIPAGTTSTSSTSSYIEVFSSTDGKTWTARQTILDTVNTGYDIVAPSMIKLNSKYYMFGTDIADQTHITIFEATSILGPYTEINRISTGTLGALWHCEVRYLNSEFIVIGSTNGTNGGSLMLGKFSSVMDATVIGRNNFIAVPPATQTWNKAIYKSSFLVKPDNTMELFIGYKGQALNTTTGWRVVKSPVVRVAQTLDLTAVGYGTEFATYADNSAGVVPGKSIKAEYYKYTVDFTVTDLTGKFIAYSSGTTQWAGIYNLNGALYAEVWKSGSNSLKTISYGLSVNDRVTFERDSDCKVYINGRLVHTFTGLDTILDAQGMFFGDLNSKVSMSNIKVYLKDQYTPTQAKADALKAAYLSDYATTPAQFSLVDEFNRASGWISDNGVTYEQVGTPLLTGTELKPNSQSNAVLVPTTADYSVLYKLTSSNLANGWAVYLRYTDVNNNIRIKYDGVSTIYVYNKVAGSETSTTYLMQIPTPFKYRNCRLDVVGSTVSMYFDGVFWKSFPIPANTHGNKAGFSSQLAAGTYDYAIIKKL